MAERRQMPSERFLSLSHFFGVYDVDMVKKGEIEEKIGEISIFTRSFLKD